VVQGDFYIVYVQTEVGTSAPGLATDENGVNAGRSWQRVGGVWSTAPAEEGNYMIRAVVKYPVNAPVLTQPTNTYTNQPTFDVSGTSPAAGAQIKIYNGKEVAGTTIVENGKFKLNVKLRAGVNAITAEAVVNGKTTDRSLPVVIILDQTAPVLTVLTPEEGSRINTEVVHITGDVQDQFLDKVTINGQKVKLEQDRSFNHRILVNEGKNTITIIATDIAGNKTTVTRTVYVERSLPGLTNISPAEDVRIVAGETITVSFDSIPKLQASFRIELPSNLSTQAGAEIPLVETEPGHYTGIYTTASSLVLEGGVIVIRAQDAAGNKVEVEAPGRLFVSAAEAPDTNVPADENPLP
jgi:bacillopeptidase F